VVRQPQSSSLAGNLQCRRDRHHGAPQPAAEQPGQPSQPGQVTRLEREARQAPGHKPAMPAASWQATVDQQPLYPCPPPDKATPAHLRHPTSRPCLPLPLALLPPLLLLHGWMEKEKKDYQRDAEGQRERRVWATLLGTSYHASVPHPCTFCIVGKRKSTAQNITKHALPR